MSPSGWFSQPVFIPGGDPESMNEPTLLYGGQLGIRFTYTNPIRTAPAAEGPGLTNDAGTSKSYKLVKTDSTMTVAPFSGAVAWFADQNNYLVTTNTATPLGRGRIAGVFRNSVTPGNFCCIQVKGKCPTMFVDSPTAAPTAAGLFVIGSTTNAKADCVSAAPTFPTLGRTAGTIQGGTGRAMVDLDVFEVL